MLCTDAHVTLMGATRAAAPPCFALPLHYTAHIPLSPQQPLAARALMDTDESITAGVKAVCDALCTVLGVKVPLRLIPHPQSTKPHIVIKRDTPKADDASDIDPKCARFTFVANKRINVNKGAVLLFGIEQPTPEAAPKSTAPSVDSFLLEADLIGASDEEEDAPKPGKQAKSEVKRARSEARKNMVALPPKMRKALGQKLPNMYYAGMSRCTIYHVGPSSQ